MILIVDDKSENIFSLKSLLQLNLFEVDTAHSGVDALKKVLKKDYEVIILDVQMPDMDGYEVAETIRGYSKSKNIPIIFLSAVNIDKRFITKGYTAGGYDYLPKPFDPDLLMLKVKMFQKLYRQTQELNDVKKSLEKTVLERTRQLREQNSELEARNDELLQYAYIASHDLQEPLRKISTFSEIISDRFLNKNEDALSYTKRITNAANRMRELIDNLLKHSQLADIAKFEKVNLNNVILGVISDFELSISEKNATIELGELPVIEAIGTQISQVFLNLLNNALKFSRSDTPPLIKIEGWRIRAKDFNSEPMADGPFLRISFTDNGIGFDEKYLTKIFLLFQRLHGRETYTGTGIGLAIVKKVIDNHNGIITAKSSEGLGTTFIIVLPVENKVKTTKNS